MLFKGQLCFGGVFFFKFSVVEIFPCQNFDPMYLRVVTCTVQYCYVKLISLAEPNTLAFTYVTSTELDLLLTAASYGQC